METNILHTHRDLIESSKIGNRGAQHKLYNLYIDAMYNVCMRMVRNVEDAEDVVQEAFIEAFTRMDSFRYESTFGSWLKRIVINRSINHLKKRKLPIVELEGQKMVASEEEEEIKIDRAIELQKVEQGIAKLPSGYQQILTLYLIEGYDHVEIGEILSIATSTSKSQYHRAKKKLIEIIEAL